MIIISSIETENQLSYCGSTLIDFTLAITLIESPCVSNIGVLGYNLKLATLGRKILDRLYIETTDNEDD